MTKISKLFFLIGGLILAFAPLSEPACASDGILFTIKDYDKKRRPEATQAELCRVKRKRDEMDKRFREERFSRFEDKTGQKKASPGDSSSTLDEQIQFLDFFRTRVDFILGLNLGRAIGLQACLEYVYGLPSAHSSTKTYKLVDKKAQGLGWTAIDMACEEVMGRFFENNIISYYEPMQLNLALAAPARKVDEKFHSEASMGKNDSYKISTDLMHGFDDNPVDFFLDSLDVEFRDPKPLTLKQKNKALNEYYGGISNRCWCLEYTERKDFETQIDRSWKFLKGSERKKMAEWLKVPDNFCLAIERSQKSEGEGFQEIVKAIQLKTTSPRLKAPLVRAFNNTLRAYRDWVGSLKRPEWRKKRYDDYLSLLERAPILSYISGPAPDPREIQKGLRQMREHNQRVTSRLHEKDRELKLESRLQDWKVGSLTVSQKEELRDDLLFYVDFHTHFERLGQEFHVDETFNGRFEINVTEVTRLRSLQRLKNIGFRLGSIIAAAISCRVGPKKIRKLKNLSKALKGSRTVKASILRSLRKLGPWCLAGIGIPVNMYIFGEATSHHLAAADLFLSSPDGDFQLAKLRSLDMTSRGIIFAGLFLPVGMHLKEVRNFSSDVGRLVTGKKWQSLMTGVSQK